MVFNLSNPDVIAAALAQVGRSESFVVDSQAVSGQLVSHLSLAHLFLQTQGSLRATQTLTLPGNAVLERLLVKVTAKRADVAYAATVAQLRGEPGETSTDRVIIVDFGTLRTVARVNFDVDCNIQKVEAWSGTEFPPYAAYPYANYDTPSGPPSGNRAVALNSDVRTQKLRVTVAASADVDQLMEGMTLMLPDAPRDLTLKIDAGAPVWSLPGPAVKGTGSALTTEAWNDANARLIDLTEVLAARLGDPLAPTDRAFELLLESAESGVLALEIHEQIYHRIRRAEIAGKPRIERDFTDEGQEPVVLSLPDAPAHAQVQELRLTAIGAFGLERRLPPVGPDPARTPDGAADLAALSLSPDRAVVFQLDPAGLPALSGVRLNLTAGADGAEVSLVPWAGTDGADLPSAALADLTGDPLTLDPGDNGWVTLSFAGPVAGPPPPWAALIVTRGTVETALAPSGAPFRMGPPGGPWRALALAFQTGALGDLGVACRSIGAVDDPLGLPPITLSLAGATGVVFEPNDTPRRLTLAAPEGTGLPDLSLTRLGPGTLTLTEIDVITDI